jgi:hypothetical protein
MMHARLLPLVLCLPTAAWGQTALPVGQEADRPIAITLSPLFTIGGADAERVELTTVYPRDVAGTTDERVTFLDRTNSRVITVGKTGRVEWVAGRRGQGPGELRVPGFVVPNPDGFVSVWDNGKTALLNFDDTGKLHSEVRMADVGLAQGMRLRGLGDVMVARSQGDRMLLLHRRGEVAVEVASRTNLPARSVPSPECDLLDYPVRPIFAPDFLWDHANGLTVVNLDGSYALQFRDASGRAWVARRGKAERRSTPALARERIGEGPNVSVGGGSPCRIPGSRILATAEIRPTIPAYSRLVIAPDTTVWAVRYALSSEPAQADLYSPRTGYLGTVSLGVADPIGFRTDGAMISLEVDDDEVPRIVVYSVGSRR